MGSIFGGSKQKSSSSNQAYGTINNWAQPLLGYANQGAQGLAALLGGDTSGLNNYKSATGFDRTLSTGMQNITNAGAAKGLLRSGATSKALVNYGQQLEDQTAGSYMDRLLGLSGIGSNAANILSGAGQTSQSSGKSKNGIGGFLGSAAGAIAASDRRLKENVRKIETLDDGLNVYEYTYIWAPDKVRRGVMADEVEKLRPWALGPKIGDYNTVDYSKIGEEVQWR